MNDNPETRNSIDASNAFAEQLDDIARAHGLTQAGLRAYFGAIMREERIKCPQKAIQLDSLIGRDA